MAGEEVQPEQTRWLARVTDPEWHGAALVLRPDYTWEVTDPDYSAELSLARALSVGYRYGPADGRPGAMLAHRVSQAIPGSSVELPPAPPERPGVVY